MKTRFIEVEEEMFKKGIMKSECPVQMNKLVLLEVPYKNFEGEIKHGEILVLSDLEEGVKNSFARLLEIDFRINSISLISEFEGSDRKSMEANNSSSFNCRNIEGSSRYSKHAYGVAIDINPVQNPFISGDGTILPEGGKEYFDRDNMRMGMVTTEVIKIFAENKFSVWGGDWESIKDYHHFEIPEDMINSFLGGDALRKSR